MDPIYVKLVGGEWRVECPFCSEGTFSGGSPMDVKVAMCHHLGEAHEVKMDDAKGIVQIVNPAALRTPLSAPASA